MVFKTTKKAVMDGYYKIISIGYCDLQNLLYTKSRIAYTSGVYGWNADVYDFGSVAIVTGYRPFGNVSVDYATVQQYDELAEKINCNYKIPYDERKELVNMLLEEFILNVADVRAIEI